MIGVLETEEGLIEVSGKYLLTILMMILPENTTKDNMTKTVIIPTANTIKAVLSGSFILIWLRLNF